MVIWNIANILNACLPRWISVLNVLTPESGSISIVLYEVNIHTQRDGSPCKTFQDKRINRSRSVRFNKKQKEYLLHIYTVFQTPKDHYTQITNELNQIGFPGQVITNQKIYVWFKNQRYRNRNT